MTGGIVVTVIQQFQNQGKFDKIESSEKDWL